LLQLLDDRVDGTLVNLGGGAGLMGCILGGEGLCQDRLDDRLIVVSECGLEGFPAPADWIT
jgi:hypothetical protein